MTGTGPGPSGSVRDAESLLERLANSALDDDYYAVHATDSSRWARMLSALLVAVFGLVLAMVAIQTERNRPTEDLERQALIDNIAVRQDLLVSRRVAVESLQEEIDSLAVTTGGSTQSLAADAMNASAVPVVGPGLVLTLSSAPGDRDFGTVTDTDVQLVVNGLWMAGAEAIDVGGKRLTTTSAIRSAGSGITVNFKSLSEPITIRAIGNTRRMTEQFEKGPSGRYLEHRATVAGIDWTLVGRDAIRMAGAPDSRLALRTASATKRGDR